MMKYLTGLLLLLICLLGLPALADTQYILTQTDAPALLRARPSADASVLGAYYTGTGAAAGEVRGDWTQVTIGKQNGWMLSRDLSASCTASRQPAGIPMAGADVGGVNWLNLRQKPSPSARVIARLGEMDAFRILGETADGWLLISGQREGYVRSEYVQRFDGDADYSRWHCAPREGIDILYPRFDHMPDQLNVLLAQKAEALAQEAGTGTLRMDCAVTLMNTQVMSVVFWGEMRGEESAEATPVLRTMTLELSTLRELRAGDLFRVDDTFTAQLLDRAQAPGDLLETAAQSVTDALRQALEGRTLGEDTTFFLTDEGAVFSVPSPEGHAEGLLTWEDAVPWYVGLWTLRLGAREKEQLRYCL